MRIFKKKKGKALPEISTASLPDIIFMLLFFFMVVTVMRTTSDQLNISLPATPYNEKVKQVHSAVNIYVTNEVDHVFVNEQPVRIAQLEDHLTRAVSDVDFADRLTVPVYLRVDKGSQMKKVYDVKLALRKTNLRKVNYIVKTKSKT